MPGRGDDHAAAAIANHSKRPRIQLLHMLVVAGGDRSDGCVEILDDRAFQILRLKPFAAQRPVAAP